MPENLNPHFLEIPQQDLQDLLSQETVPDEELQHALDRSCTLHCLEAVFELHSMHVPSLDRVDEYVAFLREHGAHPETGTKNDKLYSVDDGWYNIALADLLRLEGYEVIVQSLKYDEQNSDATAATNSGRIRSDREARDFQRLSEFGGEGKNRWIESVKDTLSRGGFTLVSIEIPSSKQAGAVGRHTVAVTSVGEQDVEYFDPDKLAFDRYGEEAPSQHIHRSGGKKLIYSQDTKSFLRRMTGEVMHIFPPSPITLDD